MEVFIRQMGLQERVVGERHMDKAIGKDAVGVELNHQEADSDVEHLHLSMDAEDEQ